MMQPGEAQPPETLDVSTLVDLVKASNPSASERVIYAMRSSVQFLWFLTLFAASLVACSAIGTLVIWGFYGIQP